VVLIQKRPELIAGFTEATRGVKLLVARSKAFTAAIVYVGCAAAG